MINIIRGPINTPFLPKKYPTSIPIDVVKKTVIVGIKRKNIEPSIK